MADRLRVWAPRARQVDLQLADERLSMRPAGNNAHAVAVDPATHEIFMPFSSATAPAGCATCDEVPPTGGVLVFQGP